MFVATLRRISALFSGVASRSEVTSVTPLAQVPATTVETERERNNSPVVASVRQKKQTEAKRFRRTPEEIKAGLSIEEARRARAVTSKKTTVRANPVVPTKSIESKKRFRRTREEIRLGLSIEQAMERRAKAAPPAEPKHYVEREVPKKQVATELFESLPKKIQTRANAVWRYRRGGGKAPIDASTLDMIEAAISAGKITHCPPCIDSDGYDHLNSRAA